MSWQPVLLLAAGGLIAAPAAAQTPPARMPPQQAAPPALAPPAAPAFPIGAEVLSVDGEPLGVLARMETRPGGERILHIRRADGSIMTAPSVVAFRGERAVVLDWTRAEVEAGQTRGEAIPEVAATPVPPLS